MSEHMFYFYMILETGPHMRRGTANVDYAYQEMTRNYVVTFDDRQLAENVHILLFFTPVCNHRKRA